MACFSLCEVKGSTQRLMAHLLFLGMAILCTGLAVSGPESFAWETFEAGGSDIKYGLTSFLVCNGGDCAGEQDYEFCKNDSDSIACDCENAGKLALGLMATTLAILCLYVISIVAYLIDSKVICCTNPWLTRVIMKVLYFLSVLTGLIFAIVSLDGWRSECHSQLGDVGGVKDEALAGGWIVGVFTVIFSGGMFVGLVDIWGAGSDDKPTSS